MTGRPFPEEEPRSELRIAAQHLREMYVALVQAGFTPREALIIVGQALVGGSRGETTP